MTDPFKNYMRYGLGILAFPQLGYGFDMDDDGERIAWNVALGRVKFGSLPIVVYARRNPNDFAKAPNKGALMLVVEMSVKDRDSGDEIKIQSMVDLTRHDVKDAPDIAFRAAMDLYLHELREQYTLDGERVKDPHKTSATTSQNQETK